MRRLRIDFVEGKEHPVYTFIKTFRLCFNKRSKGFVYSGCFCWQDYPRCFIKSNNRIVGSYKVIRAPTIIVAKQSNFLKTSGLLIHELGHYIIWLLFYWKKTRFKILKKIELEAPPELYKFFDNLYDNIDRRIFSLNNISV